MRDVAGERKTVFVVDDDASVRRSLQRLLSSAGYETGLCASAQEFLALTEIPRPACVVLDIRMPGVTGIELQALLRDLHPDLPVILTSGHADAARAGLDRSTGAVAFLQKPFDAVELFAALDKAFERSLRRPQPGEDAHD